MYLYGANPDELDHLGTTLQRQIDAVQGVTLDRERRPGRHHLDGTRATIASGPSGTARFTGALQRLNEAFTAAGRDCLQRSTALRQVMGA